MKLTIELEIDRKIQWKPDVTRERQLAYLQRHYIEQINQLIVNEKLDDSKYERGDPNHLFCHHERLNIIDFQE